MIRKAAPAIAVLVLLAACNGKAQLPPEATYGADVKLTPPDPNGPIPVLNPAKAVGWPAGAAPTAPAGFTVTRYAEGLEHPRNLFVLPNGDLLVVESNSPPREKKGLTDWVAGWMMKRAGAATPSANRITLLRDADGDGVAEIQAPFMEGLNQPFGMALVGDTFYVGNTDGVMAFPYAKDATRIDAPGKRVTTFKPGGHWTRSLLVSQDGTKLYAGVGSLTNIADDGMEAEEGRAAIHVIDIASGSSRIFAGGLRNAVGMAWEPTTGKLWTVVNERDGLGDETPPDYLTSVVDGGFYGWPYSYWDRIVDDRVPQNPELVARSITPDFALGGHTASLGLCWMPAGTLPGFPDGMVIGQHGSWNRSKLSGYKVVFVPFENGKPSGPSRDILWGFLAPDESVSYGRPVGVTLGPDNSLLMADDVGNVIWRVTAA